MNELILVRGELIYDGPRPPWHDWEMDSLTRAPELRKAYALYEPTTGEVWCQRLPKDTIDVWEYRRANYPWIWLPYEEWQGNGAISVLTWMIDAYLKEHSQCHKQSLPYQAPKFSSWENPAQEKLTASEALSRLGLPPL